MVKPKISFLQQLYQKIRDAAEDWSHETNMDNHCVFETAYFWVRISRKSNISSVLFRAAADQFLKKLEENGLINDLLPVKLSITKSNNSYDIEGVPLRIGEQLTESILLTKLAEELIRGFKYAEEAHYAEQGKNPGYTITLVGPKHGEVTINMNLKFQSGSKAGSFDSANQRLFDYAHEFFDEHLIKPEIGTSRKIKQYSLHLTIPG